MSRLYREALAAVAMMGAACAGEPRVEMRTGAATARVEHHDGIAVDVPFTLRAPATQTVVASGLTMTLHATVQAPKVNGQTLQATDVQWYGHRLVASYNFRGTTDQGAMQIIDATNPADPHVLVEAIYPRADLNRIALRGSRVIAAAADQDLGATLERFTLTGNALTYDDYTQLPSFGATYVDIDGSGAALVTYGDDGGAARYDLDDDQPTPFDALPILDARWIGAVGDDLLVVAGTPARIERHAGGFGGTVTTRPIPGGTVGAPTWALVKNGILYVAADEAGVLVFDATSLAQLGSVPLGGDGNGLALTSDRRVLFAAGGQGGLVAIDAGDPTTPAILSSIDTPTDAGSANAVAINEHQLALADGLAGIKILTFSRKAAPDDDPDDVDGDGVAAARDVDDDDDNVVDTYDLAPTDPDAVCSPNQPIAEVGAIADVFVLGCDHPDVGVATSGRVRGARPTDRDWFSPTRHARTVGTTTITALTPTDHGVAPSSCGEAYVATRWRTTAIAEAGAHRLRLATTDDGWLFVDGQLAIDLGGAHDLLADEVVVPLTAGAHVIEVYSVRRRPIAAHAELRVVGGPGLVLGERTCLAPDADADNDGTLNIDDVAPLRLPRR